MLSSSNKDIGLLTSPKIRKWFVISSIIFALGSLCYLIISVKTSINTPSYDNEGQSLGYALYSVGYNIYFIAEFKNDRCLYIFSTNNFSIPGEIIADNAEHYAVCFITASLVFVILSIMTLFSSRQYNLDNIANLLGNLGWLLGYVCSFKGELLSPIRNNLDQLSAPFLQHLSIV